MAYNLLIAGQGGILHLDEPFREQPSAATVSLYPLNTRGAEVGNGFASVTDAACTLDDLVLTLPAKNAPWKIVCPINTQGTVGDLTDEGRRFLLNRGGRRTWPRVSEYDFDGDVVSEIRFDEGIDFALKTGDTLRGIRVSYDFDLNGLDFVGKARAVWKVTVGGVVQTTVRVYDIMRQEIKQPATWDDVLNLRPDADDQLSQVANKERFVAQAWNNIVQQLYTMGIRHHLVIQDGSTALKDLTVIQCIHNLVMYQGLSIPDAYIGQGEDYIDRLVTLKAQIMGPLRLAVDENQDGKLTSTETNMKRRQVWFGRNQVLERDG
jgi:hypothetical protein